VEDLAVSTGTTNPLARDLDEVLEAMGDLWEELRDARIFITGGTGFFGCWLLETLLWASDRLRLNVQVTVLTRNRAAFEAKAPHLAKHVVVTLHDGDVRDFAFPSGRFTHVVHAATTSSAPVKPLLMFDTIVSGTRRALEFAQLSGAKRFLLTSSGAVYGKQPPDLLNIPEEYVGAPDCVDPNNAYGEGKRAAEMLCAVYASKSLQPVIARCFAFVGPYLPLEAHFAVGNFIRDALNGGPIRVAGDGTPFRSYLYGSELAMWLWSIALRGAPLRPYNVGSTDMMTIREVAERVASCFKPRPTVTVATPLRSGVNALRYVPNVDRARRELRLAPLMDLKEGVRRTAEWHRGATAGARLS
jgi:nucleoside-diphosphate-sugar epimerase